MKPPIADPFAPPSLFPAGEVRVFRQSFWRVYFGTVLLSFLMLPGFCLVLWFWDARVLSQLFSFFGLLVLFQMLMVPFGVAFGASLNPVKVSRSGIQIAVLRGFHPWSQMKSARHLWLGLPYIRVALQGQWFKIWVPLTLRDSQGFARAVEAWAPQDNPLRELLSAKFPR